MVRVQHVEGEVSLDGCRGDSCRVQQLVVLDVAIVQIETDLHDFFIDSGALMIIILTDLNQFMLQLVDAFDITLLGE